jgi:ABC-2 type transport system ATP-binding protein
MITVDALSKSYGSTSVVQEVSFHCEPGTITGFLGPNGAGKSTTLRMVTGLTHPDRGTATVAGRRYSELPNPLRIVGTLLDASAMHTGRTGRNTLAIAARTAGLPTSRVDETLQRVGLAGPAADRRVGDYSLGMRQRLGIGQALLGDPQVLILDEPANGLDPEGILWMRNLLRDFADQGGTVLLSSHLLSEVQATVDHLVVIKGGTVAAAGPLDVLLTTSNWLVRATDPHALGQALAAGGVAFHRNHDHSLSVDMSQTGIDPTVIAQLAMESNVLITELRAADSGNLEQLFFSLTSGDASAADHTQEAAA